MESVLRPLALYVTLLVMMRLSGKRSLGEVTAFDFVLLLIISEAVSNAIVGPDTSLTGATVAITTLLLVDIGVSMAARRWRTLATLLDEEPVVVAENGRVIEEHIRKERLDEQDIIEAARAQGLEGLTDVKQAVLERHGSISVIPRESVQHR